MGLVLGLEMEMERKGKEGKGREGKGGRKEGR